MQQSNTPATVSLVAGIATLVLVMAWMCLSFVPILSLLNLFILPMQFVTALVALIAGIVGYRTAGALDGIGRGASIAGIGIAIAWGLMQMLIWGLAFLAIVLVVIGSAVSG